MVPEIPDVLAARQDNAGKTRSRKNVASFFIRSSVGQSKIPAHG
jgi:hypothetical protein